MWKYGTVSEKWLFHGTKEENIYGICQNNFNWRLCKKHKYGMGVNFAPFSSYAAHYCDKTRTKVMVLSRVIIGNSCFWTKTMPWPLEPYDTVISGGRNVVVKFDDHSFYPDYLIYFRK
ncbi:hypothetical protein JTB14_035407 [Gonioctena quinquepunctata]|nr:hypothetical protein JTB14_035407 [Gonioctena quinquepunctata]